MPVLNIICPICTDVFNNGDDIYSTSCGHLFHFSCMNDWQRRGTSCPQCRHYNPTTHKLYLSFDGSEENSEKHVEMELKLKTSNEKITQLLLQMSESETNFLELQKQFTAIEKSKRDIEEKIRQMHDSENNFMHLQGQYTESSELVRALQDRLNQLFIENECKSKELELKRLENESLKTSVEAEQSCSSDGVLYEKVKVLEQKLKHISEEFQKEISTSTQLSIDNMRLQSYVNHLKSLEKVADLVPKQSDKKVFNRQIRECLPNPYVSTTHANNSIPINDDNCNSALVKGLPFKQITIPFENPAVNDKRASFKQNHENLPKPYVAKKYVNNLEKTDDGNRNSVFIKGLPLNQITIPLESTVVNLASKMNLYINADDVVKANFMDNKGESSPSQLHVEFKNSKLRDDFLSKKSFLKNDPATRFVAISEFISADVVELFKYAKEKLQYKGYGSFFFNNNKVFAKRSRHDRYSVEIVTKSQVDLMSMVNEKASAPQELNTNVDENFYQL